jgi:hypothetical protein
VSELLAFGELGVRHIVDPAALDHTLFLLVLAAAYSLQDWRKILLIVTGFTAGHSVTLALAATETLGFPASLVEFLIPVTIVAAAVENVAARNRDAQLRARWRPVVAGLFGLIHGAGFANYLESLAVGPILVPLLGFNLGIEIGQVVVLAAAFALLGVLDLAIAAVRGHARRTGTALRTRSVLVSSVVGTVAAVWAVERSPW